MKLGDILTEPWRQAEQGRLTRGKHRVQKKHPSLGDIRGQFLIEQLRLTGLFISLDQDLTNPHRSTAVSESLLHCLACSHDGYTTDLPLESDAEISTANRSCDRVFDHRQMIQALLDQETYNPIRVENEVCPIGFLVSDHSGASEPSAVSFNTGVAGHRTLEEQSTGESGVAHGHSRKIHPSKLSRLAFRHRACRLGQRPEQGPESDILADGSWLKIEE